MHSDNGPLINHLYTKSGEINYERQETTTKNITFWRFNIPKSCSALKPATYKMPLNILVCKGRIKAFNTGSRSSSIPNLISIWSGVQQRANSSADWIYKDSQNAV